MWSLILIAVLLIGAAGAPVASQAPIKPTPYYPLVNGDCWHYRAGKDHFVMRVVRQKAVGKFMCVELEATDGRSKEVEHVTAQKDGVYRCKWRDKEITPPLLLLKLPFRKGDTWKVDSDSGGLKITGTFTAREEEVQVLGKKHKAIKVICGDFQIGDSLVAMTSWFVPGIGLVKQSLRVGGLERVIELEKYQVTK
jgi:hypothetical protein